MSMERAMPRLCASIWLMDGIWVFSVTRIRMTHDQTPGAVNATGSLSRTPGGTKKTKYPQASLCFAQFATTSLDQGIKQHHNFMTLR